MMLNLLWISLFFVFIFIHNFPAHTPWSRFEGFYYIPVEWQICFTYKNAGFCLREICKTVFKFKSTQDKKAYPLNIWFCEGGSLKWNYFLIYQLIVGNIYNMLRLIKFIRYQLNKESLTRFHFHLHPWRFLAELPLILIWRLLLHPCCMTNMIYLQ